MGHGGNTVTRMPEAAKGIEKLDLLVVADPHPTTWAVLSERKDNTYLLPIATSYETDGSRTSSNRSIQWGEQIVKPIFESKDDNEVMYLLAKKLGFADQMFKNIKVENNVPVAEDILREINRGGWSTGYCGQSPERLKAHMENQDKIRPGHAARAEGRAGHRRRLLRSAVAVLGHAGVQASRHAHCSTTPTCPSWTAAARSARASASSAWSRSRCRRTAEVETQRYNLLGRRLLLQGLRDQGRLSGVHARRAQEARLGQGPDRGRAGGDPAGSIRPIRTRCPGRSICRAASSASRSKHGCIPYGNGKARANAFGLPDAIPVHREPIYTPRPELVAKYPTLPNARQFRMPNVGFDVQKAAVEKGIAKQFPLILTSGRLVEYEGGGEETRSNKWLAELQQDMFIEINPADATERGIKDGGWVWVTGAENQLQGAHEGAGHRARRQGRRLVPVPLRAAGSRASISARKYPKGADPIVLGESVNTLTTYGYDPVTGMQEPKATLCQIRAA